MCLGGLDLGRGMDSPVMPEQQITSNKRARALFASERSSVTMAQFVSGPVLCPGERPIALRALEFLGELRGIPFLCLGWRHNWKSARRKKSNEADRGRVQWPMWGSLRGVHYMHGSYGFASDRERVPGVNELNNYVRTIFEFTFVHGWAARHRPAQCGRIQPLLRYSPYYMIQIR